MSDPSTGSHRKDLIALAVTLGLVVLVSIGCSRQGHVNDTAFEPASNTSETLAQLSTPESTLTIPGRANWARTGVYPGWISTGKYKVKWEYVGPEVWYQGRFPMEESTRSPSSLVKPVVDGGTVAVESRGDMFIGSKGDRSDWQILLLNLSDGELIGRVEEGYSPALADGVLYAARKGRLIAFDVMSRERIWTFRLPGESTDRPPVLSSIAVDEDRVYVGTSQEWTLTGPGGGFLAAVDRATGREAWSVNVGAPVNNPISLAAGVVYVSSYYDNYVFARRADSGLPVWQFQATYPVLTPVAVDGDTAYFGDLDTYLYAVDSRGVLKWRFKTGGAVKWGPAVAHGSVYFASEEDWLWAVDATTGRLRWSVEQAGWSDPLVAGDKVWASRHLFPGRLFDAITGEEFGTIGIPDPELRSSEAVVLGDQILIAGGGSVFLLEPE